VGDADCSHREVRPERILKWRQRIVRCAWRDPGIRRGTNRGGSPLRPRRKDRVAPLKEDEQVGGAVIVKVLDNSRLLVRRIVELLDEIDTVVKVAIRFSAYEYTAFVVLANVRSAIEVGIDGHFGELAVTIVQAPDVGPAVAVPILSAGGAGARP
jgi:hypothetical protein